MSKDKKHREHAAGKGDAKRPVDKKAFDENHERIFGKKEVKK